VVLEEEEEAVPELMLVPQCHSLLLLVKRVKIAIVMEKEVAVVWLLLIQGQRDVTRQVWGVGMIWFEEKLVEITLAILLVLLPQLWQPPLQMVLLLLQ
jgi:hypothetical protein